MLLFTFYPYTTNMHMLISPLYFDAGIATLAYEAGQVVGKYPLRKFMDVKMHRSL